MVLNWPDIKRNNIEVISATVKKMTFAVIDEPMYLATELFIGK
jgi:hypothetical protein